MASDALAAPLHSIAFSAQAQMPAVLVVDDDKECSAQCARMLDDLNYRHYCVASARDALDRLARDPTIHIIVADMQMPSTDGFVLIKEARARLGETRPLAAIMLTECVTADLAVRGLHVEAVDLLCKPIAFEAYSSALRRAVRYLANRRAVIDGSGMSDVKEELSRLASLLESNSAERKGETKLSDSQMSATLRTIIGSRGLRNRYFPGQIFADPAWDILLDLTRAKLEGQQVSVSSVCIAAAVPMSTALRWVRQMIEAGLLRRWTDPKDRRRDLIALTDGTAAHMRDYLSAVHVLMTRL